MKTPEKILENTRTNSALESLVLQEKSVKEIAQILGVKGISRQLKILPIDYYRENVIKSTRYITLTREGVERLLSLIETCQIEKKNGVFFKEYIEEKEGILFQEFETFINNHISKKVSMKVLWHFLIRYHFNLFIFIDGKQGGKRYYALKRGNEEVILDIVKKRIEFVSKQLSSGKRNPSGIPLGIK